jgi:hypothetical protein
MKSHIDSPEGVYALLVEANPVADAEPTVRPHLTVVDEPRRPTMTTPIPPPGSPGRRLRVLGVAAVLIAAMAVTSMLVFAGDEDEPTATTAPETTTTTQSTTTTLASADPADPLASPYVGGTPGITLSDGTEGSVEVIAAGSAPPRPAGPTTIPIVLRNRTGNSVVNVAVSVTVRDPGGELWASGSSRVLSPSRIEPGEIAFGDAYLGWDVIPPEGSTYEFEVTYEIAGDGQIDAEPRRDLEVTTSEWSGEHVAGEASNPHGERVSDLQAHTICFDQFGGITGYNREFMEQGEVEADSTVRFAVPTDSPVPFVCDRYLVAVSGITGP